MPDQTKIHESRDFPDLIRAAAGQLNATAGIIEKDYWVTEVLRALATSEDFHFLFKGGTSLSKGYALIRRFSEDVDILILDRPGNKPGQSIGKRLLKMAEDSAVSINGVKLNKEHEDSFSGKTPPKRTSILSFPYDQNDQSILPYIKLEMSIHSGTFPSETKQITSLIAQQIVKMAPENAKAFSNITTFNVNCLDPLRTFAEKVNALASAARKGELVVRARHYYDLYYLLGTVSIVSRLDSDEYLRIKEHVKVVDQEMRQYDESHDYVRPGSSKAFSPSAEVLDQLRRAYEGSSLYYGSKPKFDEIIDRVSSMRDRY